MKLTAILVFMTLSQVVQSQSFVEKMGSTPATKLDLAMYKLNEQLSEQIKNMGTLWGLSSGVTYYASEVIESKSLLHVVLYTKAQARNLNLNSCSSGIMEFNKHHDYLGSIKDAFSSKGFLASDDEIRKNTVIKLVIVESSNRSLMFQCDWPMHGDKVYAVQ